MKRSFFLSILTVLIATTVIVSAVHFHFFTQERIRLIDQQIEVIASNLIESDLENAEASEISDLVAEALGEDPAITLISLYTHRGDLVFRNQNAIKILGDVELPTNVPRATYEVKDHRVRALNIELSYGAYILQVALVLDAFELSWDRLAKETAGYAALVLIVMLVASFLLTKWLLRPLREIGGYLKNYAETVGSTNGTAALPLFLTKKIQANDEFSELLRGVQSLREKMDSRFKLNQATAAQMAHELKTPLTFIRNSLEIAENRVELSQSSDLKKLLRNAEVEIDQLSNIINEFLSWSRFEYTQTPATETLHALKLGKILAEIVDKLNSLSGSRIDLHIDKEETVFAKPELLEQVLRNLLENALKFSPENKNVRVSLKGYNLEIIDEGPGIPKHVLDRLGEPFNQGATEEAGRSTGLGLAWVNSICHHYGWTLKFSSSGPGPGTIASVVLK